MRLIRKITPKSMLIELLNNACTEYEHITRQLTLNYFPNIIALLQDIREPVWLYFRKCFPSLRRMDCNTQFSEIFQVRNFVGMNESEENISLWKTRHQSFFNALCSPIHKTLSIFVNFSKLTCTRCKRDKIDPQKFSEDNSMIPSAVPPELQNLT